MFIKKSLLKQLLKHLYDIERLLGEVKAEVRANERAIWRQGEPLPPNENTIECHRVALEKFRHGLKCDLRHGRL